MEERIHVPCGTVFIYAIIIGTIGSILNNAIEDYNLRFISSGVIDFICTSLIALILTIKLFLIINQFEKAQVNKGRDVTSTRILARVIKITIIVAIVLLYGEHFGMSLSGLLTLAVSAVSLLVWRAKMS